MFLNVMIKKWTVWTVESTIKELGNFLNEGNFNWKVPSIS